MPSKKLARQLSKLFDLDDFEKELASLLEAIAAKKDHGDEVPRIQKILGTLPEFLSWVDDSHRHLEERAEMAARSLELSSKELFAVNSQMAAMLNSLGEGFLVFGPDGICLPNYSKACEDLFEVMPVGKHFAELIRIPQERLDKFNNWMTLLFKEPIDFEDIVAIGPRVITANASRHITLSYKPLRDDDGKIEKIVLIATDRTAERKAQRAADQSREYAEMIVKIASNKNQFLGMVRDLRKFSRRLTELARSSGFGQESLSEACRILHTAKGAVASFSMSDLKDAIHGFEQQLDSYKKGELADFAAVPAKLLGFATAIEEKIHFVLKTHEDIIGADPERRGRSREVPLATLYAFAHYLGAGAEGKDVVREFTFRLISVPIQSLFSQFDLVAQSTAERVQKKVYSLKIAGDNFPVIPEAYDELIGSLVHVFRNAVDHGIESLDERTVYGKDPCGTLTVNVAKKGSVTGNEIEIAIADDGRGINPSGLREKLISRGILREDSKESDEELIQHVFDPGFSTRDQVTEVSGRGVGLDVVKAAVLKMKGQVHAESIPGEGLKIVLRVPLVDVLTFDLLNSFYQATDFV